MNPFLGNLKSLAKCPLCRKRYTTDPSPVFEEESRSVFYASCSSCGSSSVLFISMNQWGIASVGALTDLGGDEVKEYLGGEAVSTEYALDAYTALGGSIDSLREVL